jgi:hypothetical protein
VLGIVIWLAKETKGMRIPTTDERSRTKLTTIQDYLLNRLISCGLLRNIKPITMKHKSSRALRLRKLWRLGLTKSRHRSTCLMASNTLVRI